MGATIPGWSPEIERGFKEILFRFLEEIQCTRAALYLYGPGDFFLLATQYGFGRRDPLAIEHRDQIRAVLDQGAETLDHQRRRCPAIDHDTARHRLPLHQLCPQTPG